MVLRKLAPHAPHQTSDRKIEAGRAELPLVVPVGFELEDLERFRLVAKDCGCCPVYFDVTAPTLLVVKSTLVAEAGENEAMRDMGRVLPVLRQPRDRSNRSRREKEAIGYRRLRCCSACARNTATAMPDKLSLHSDG